jgi:hypothetical protein
MAIIQLEDYQRNRAPSSLSTDDPSCPTDVGSCRVVIADFHAFFERGGATRNFMF